MSYNFNGTSNVILNTTTAPVTTVPFTVSCWFNATALSGNFLTICNSTGNEAFRFVLLTGGNIRANSVAATIGSSSDSTNTCTTGTWNHACGVYASNTSRTAYLNGTAGPTNTTSSIPASISRINIGSRRANSVNDLFINARLADIGIWDIALTATEIISLSEGISCQLVRPQNLVFYAPFIRDLNDISKTKLSLTDTTGTTVSDTHPGIYL